jgi:hydrogenase expression/formation protein HypE
MAIDFLPIGKLPIEMLKQLLAGLPSQSNDIILGPGVGLDCAVVQSSDQLLVFKSDPITFASDSIGWYLVQVNLNDLVTTGALPRWLMVVILLPEENAGSLTGAISKQLQEACQKFGIQIIGGHTEITHGLDRPILVGTMIGEVSRNQLITPMGAEPGDHLLLTKGLPIEAVSIIAREFSDRLSSSPANLSPDEILSAQNYLHDPGISVFKEARIAVRVGGVHAMHDPTEGGLYAALWELAEACQHSIHVDLSQVSIPPLAKRICQSMKLDPFGTIASGALLLAVSSEKSSDMVDAIREEGIDCTVIGEVCRDPGKPNVWSGEFNKTLLPCPIRDEIAKLFE